MNPKQMAAMKAKDGDAPAAEPKLSGGPLLNAITKLHLSGKKKAAPKAKPAPDDGDGDEGAPPKSGFPLKK